MPRQNDPDPLADAMAALNKKFGAGSVYKFGAFTPPPIEAISTGSLGLDAAIGIGGIPRGRVTEIFGPFASGKTTLALEIIANAQKQGLVAAMVDAEHALDPGYAKALGVDMDAVIFSQPGSGEEALETVDMLTQTGGIGVIAIDSVAALVPQAELDGEMGKAQIGLQARLMSHALRKLTAHVSESKTACVFINQLREKVGFVLGNPETTTGGRALPFYASVRLDARGTATLKDGGDVIGRRTRVKVVKNKVGSPYRQAEFDILFGQGINRAGELLDLGQACGVIRKAGTRYYYGEQALGNGREAARNALRAEPALAQEAEAAILKIGLNGLLRPSGASSEDESPGLRIPEPRNLSAPDMTVAPDSPDSV